MATDNARRDRETPQFPTGMIVALTTITKRLASLPLILKEETVTVKQYQGTTGNDRDPQGVTSAQPPAPSSRKELSDRKGEGPKKIKSKPAGHGK